MIGERAFKLDVVSIRLVKDAPVFSRTKITNPETAIEALGNIMSDLDREVVAVVNLKSDGTPINVNFARHDKRCFGRTKGAFKVKHTFQCG